MSFKSWCKEFYPISATDRVALSNDPVTIVEHSLQKWTGLRPENLKKHNMVFKDGMVQARRGTGAGLYVDDSSCSLCQKYIDHCHPSHSCAKCPLYQARGRVPCYETKGREKNDPYGAFRYPREREDLWFDFGNNTPRDPEPMIKWLEKTLIYIRKQDKAKKAKSKTKKGTKKAR